MKIIAIDKIYERDRQEELPDYFGRSRKRSLPLRKSSRCKPNKWQMIGKTFCVRSFD